MALLECLNADCGTHYAVGLEQCPQCSYTESQEVGEMPKVTKAEGPTSVEDPGLPPYETPEPEPKIEYKAEEETAPESSITTLSEEEPRVEEETPEPQPEPEIAETRPYRRRR